MGTAVSTLVDLIQRGTGYLVDETVALAALDWAQRAVASSRECPELRTEGVLNLSAGSDSVSLGSLTNLFDVKQVWYRADANSPKYKLYYIPEELLDIVLARGTSHLSRPYYYGRRGNTLYVRPAASSDCQLVVDYVKYPSRITSITDSLEVEHYDSLITSVAIAIAWGFYEERDSVDIWAGLSKSLQEALGSEELFLKAGEGVIGFRKVEGVD